MVTESQMNGMQDFLDDKRQDDIIDVYEQLNSLRKVTSMELSLIHGCQDAIRTMALEIKGLKLENVELKHKLNNLQASVNELELNAYGGGNST